jgi:indolepyruvate ferredoxin oxidoreductase
MLKIMKNLGVLRLLLPAWHTHEKDIARTIKSLMLEEVLPKKRLLELDNIKGYREVRYKLAQKYLGKKYV